MITQDGCSIESYVEEFLQLAHQGDWNDDSLKIVFWSGLSNHLFLQAPPAATPGSLAQYIDHVLILAGSFFTVEVVPASQPLPTARPVPPPAAKSVYPRARKWASNRADLRAKVLDPSLTSVRSALKSTPSPKPAATRGEICVPAVRGEVCARTAARGDDGSAARDEDGAARSDDDCSARSDDDSSAARSDDGSARGDDGSTYRGEDCAATRGFCPLPRTDTKSRVHFVVTRPDTGVL